MEKDADARSSHQLNISTIQEWTYSGEPIRQIFTSSKSDSLPASELVPRITIRDEEHGISIEYVEGPRTREAVDLLFKRLTQKSVPPETPLPEAQLHRITIQALRQAPLMENEFVLSWQEETEAYLFFFPDKHFVQDNFKEICFQRVTPQEADILIIEQLEDTNIFGVESALQVKEHEGEVSERAVQEQPVIPEAPPIPKPFLPLLGLHEELEKVRAYDKLREMPSKKSREDYDPEKRVRVIEAYLTTNKPMGDLRDIGGVKTVEAVNQIVHRNLQKIFAELPPDVQQKYGGSAKEAIRQKASKQLKTSPSSERFEEGIAERIYSKPRGRPKGTVETQPRQYKGRKGRPEGIVETQPRKYKERTGRPKGRKDSQPRNTSRENSSKAANRRWQLYRERQAQSVPAQEPHPTSTPREHTIADFRKQSQ